MNEEVSKNIFEKSFIVSGDTYIDIKQVATFKFKKDPKGYLIVSYKLIDNPEYNIITHLANKEELSQLIMELEVFFEDPTLSSQIMPMINKLDNLSKSK